MPRGDKTGPNGEGPGTGRQQGYCSGNDSPGYAVSGRGLGRGLAKGFGRGRRPGRNSASSYQNSEILEKLGDIEKRLDDLEK